MTPSSVYLAGPMRGRPGDNFETFNVAAADLRERGIETWNPAEHLPIGLTLRDYMREDLPALLAAEAVVVLPGWEQSEGACLETHVAHVCGIPVLRFPDLASARHPSSERFHRRLHALGILHDRKQADYGRTNDPFANVRASEEWGIPGWVGSMIRGTDKVRRLQTQATRGSLANESALDAFDDLAVYAVIGRVLFEEAANELTEGEIAA